MKTPRIISDALHFILESLTVAIVLYAVFAIFFSTPQEKQLQKENAMYRRTYRTLVREQKLLGDAVENLQRKDNEIYRGLFETDAPPLDPVTAADLIADSDSLSDNFFLSYSASKSESLMRMSANVEDNFRAVFDALCDRRDSIPPLSLPLKDFSYVQAGASTGEKIHPVLKMEQEHTGIDLIAPQGTPVLASAAGTVTDVILSRRGLGNQVEIDHGNGCVTRYALLGDVAVHAGMKIRLGARIGTVGISASALNPHLHYEILFHGEPVDPMNYFFASLTPEEYSRMMYMTVSTKQSMD